MATTTKPAIGTIYRTGDESPVKGEFTCVPCEQSGEPHTVKLSPGESFPQCDNVATTWRLVSYT
jgi:hypothetical protein